MRLAGAVGIACAGLLLATPAALAQPEGPGNPSGLGAAVNLSYYHTSFAYPKASYDSDVTEAGFALSQSLSPALSMWFEAGYTQLNQSGNPEQTNFTPAGYYGRIGADYLLALSPRRFGFDFTLSGDYHHVRGYNNVTDLVQHWWSFAAAAGPWARFGAVAVEGGLVYRHASGTEEISGTQTASESFAYARTTNAYFDIVFHPEPVSAVRLHLEAGAWRGATLSFSYNFSSL